MSVVTEDAEGVEQRFEDDDPQPIAFADEVDTMKEPEVAGKKKKVIRRVVKKTKRPSEAAQEEVHVGSKLDEAAISALKSVSYYVSDRYDGVSKSLEEAVASSIDTGLAADSDVCMIVDTASRDLASTGSTASASLGIDDGEVSEACTLPKLIEKLAAARM